MFPRILESADQDCLIVEAACLYLPLLLALLGWFLTKPRQRTRTACLMATAWQLASLPWLNLMADALQWWNFPSETIKVGTLPLSLYLGWSMLWGVATPLLFLSLSGSFRVRLGITLGLAFLFDLALMPLCHPVLLLQDQWLLGELCILLLGLFPSLLLAHCVQRRRRVLYRAFHISLSFLLFFLTVCPFLLTPTGHIQAIASISQHPWWIMLPASLLIAVASCFGFSAVYWFARYGHGTPVPYDPPQRLVTTGPYRYCANPMQSCMVIVLLLMALLFHNLFCLLLAVVSLCYNEGIARWSEEGDLLKKFGSDYQTYRDKTPRYFLFRPRPSRHS